MWQHRGNVSIEDAGSGMDTLYMNMHGSQEGKGVSGPDLIGTGLREQVVALLRLPVEEE
jgi:hypothetical protein